MLSVLSFPFILKTTSPMSILDQLYGAPSALSRTLLGGLAVFIVAAIAIFLGFRKRP